jgi:murein DD-endopeptidase MepM/ murein hydrolase activator NlpD
VHVVIERSDGSRIMRVPAPRWLVSVAVAFLGVVVATAAMLSADYAFLARHRHQFTELHEKLLAQQRLVTSQTQIVDGFESRVAELRGEIEAWRELRLKLWQPFGPDADPRGQERGMGGPASRLIERVPTGSVLDDLERMTTVVTEETESLRALERYVGLAAKMMTSLPFRWPVRGPVNSEFGRRNSPWGTTDAEFHSGLDIGAKRGSQVRAPAPGIVVFAGQHAEYGTTLIIDHGGDLKTLYGHLSKIEVAADQRVERGQLVAQTGNTGRSSGPHLHYEIQMRGQPVNPRTYLWEQPPPAPVAAR